MFISEIYLDTLIFQQPKSMHVQMKKRSRTMGDETQCPASWLFGMNGSVFLIFAFGFVWKHHFKFTRR